MTGFGRCEISLPARRARGRGVASLPARVVVEVRTLNHRFLEVEIRLPDGGPSSEGMATANGKQAMEEWIRQAVARRFQRGRVRVWVNLHATETATPVVFQTRLARQYVSQLQRMKRQLRVPGNVTLETVLGLPQVVALSRGEVSWAKLWPRIRLGVERALSGAARMRRQEGQRLAKQLARFVQALDHLSRKVKKRAPVVEKALAERLAQRIQAAAQAAGAGPLAPSAVLAEAAAHVQACDVREELDRIASHLSALRQVLGDSTGRGGQALAGSPGRTIDFLAQELQREVNTLGAKMRDDGLVRCVVAMKGQIEKLREQAANVE